MRNTKINKCDYIENNDGAWECSECDAIWELSDGDPFENNMRYCPECGRSIEAIVKNGARVTWEEAKRSYKEILEEVQEDE